MGIDSRRTKLRPSRTSLKGYLVVGALACLLICPVFAQAGPIPGSSNEIVDPGFERDVPGVDPLLPWLSFPGQVLVAPNPLGNPGQAAVCNNVLPPSTFGDPLSQVVDESTNPLFNFNLHSKIIDLTADVRATSTSSTLGIRFRLEAWSEAFNNSPTPPLSAPTFATDFVEYTNLSTTYTTLNPFNRLRLNFQPRYVKVDIEFLQSISNSVYIDNVTLTSQCVPEPASLSMAGVGLVGVGLACWKKRRRIVT